MRSRFAKSPWAIAPGDPIPIQYNRFHPEDANVDLFITKWLLPLVFLASAPLDFIVAAVLFFLNKNGAL